MWIESHQSLGRHPKLIRLATVLRIHKAQAVGHLQYLWWWTLDYAPTGNLSAFTSVEISAGAEWPGEPGPFHQALLECKWIDADGFIHDWNDYAGKLLERREKDRDRKRPDSKSNSIGIPSEFHRSAIGIPQECHRSSNATVPNSTVPTVPTTPTDGACAMTIGEVCPDVPVDLPAGFPQTEEAAKASVGAIACPEDFAVKVWHTAMARGAKDAKNNTIRSWAHHLAASWAYHRESESKPKWAGNGPSNPVDEIKNQKELERVEKRLKEIADSYDSHQDMSPEHKAERRKLKERRELLKKVLGWSV